MAWIFKRTSNGFDEFWTGEVDPDGSLCTALHRCEAFHFRTREIADIVAETHAGLRNSDTWRIVQR